MSDASTRGAARNPRSRHRGTQTHHRRVQLRRSGYGLVPVVGALLGLASCRGAAPAAAPTASTSPIVTRDPSGGVVHRDTICSPYDAIAERQRALAKRDEAALARALAEANLTEARFPIDSFDSRDGGNQWEVVEASGRRDLLSPQSHDACGAGDSWRLALDGRGGVVVLMIQPRQVARHELLTCGCPADAPITCGGAARAPVRYRWALPAGVEFQGPFSLVVDHEASQIAYAGRADRAPCPVPLMPP